MSDTINMKIDFFQDEGGRAKTDSGYSVNIFGGENSAKPYELLFMALGSCMYSTFEDIYEKKRLSCESVSIKISGEKRDEVPMYLSECRIMFTVKGGDNETGFRKSFDLACKYCSIYQTLAKVAEMKPGISFLP